ncbi:exported hypothetical protein [Thiocapsa sp. KS1]|jgi:hypothetical protein|nr:hypothetical protein [Thiocapsa sp. KS1]CRI65337.1 exported hypothetical protein [Thiocapsa sp. KS1]
MRRIAVPVVALAAAVLLSASVAGAVDSATPTSSAVHSEVLIGAAGREMFVDSVYGFTIEYEQGFVVRSQAVSRSGPDATDLLASFHVMNPTMASGDLAGIEPPDLEIRIYDAGAAPTLKEWLVSAQFVSPQNERFGDSARIEHVEGLKVCQSTMVAPGCSTFVLYRGRVYQLTPASLAGESVMATFAFLAR